jgi:uncharacterized protein with HEPN domain
LRYPADYLADIQEAIADLERHAAGGREKFMADKDVQSLVFWGFTIIGEAVKRLPHSVRELEPDIPWQSIAGFRDVLVHAYHQIDLHVVWGALSQELPKLKQAVQRLEHQFSRHDLDE